MAVIKHSDYVEIVDGHRSPMIEVFLNGENVCIRQETPGFTTADLIDLSVGQAYDLLIAISHVLDIPVKANGYQA